MPFVVHSHWVVKLRALRHGVLKAIHRCFSAVGLGVHYGCRCDGGGLLLSAVTE